MSPSQEREQWCNKLLTVCTAGFAQATGRIQEKQERTVVASHNGMTLLEDLWDLRIMIRQTAFALLDHASLT